MLKRSPTYRAFTLCLALALLGAAGGSQVQSGAGSSERFQEVTLLSDGDRLAQSVAADLADVARQSDVRLDRVDVATPREFLDALARSNAKLVIVVAHGQEGLGLFVGGALVPRDELLAALEQSGARHVFFATCDLGLPARVGDTDVTSFAGPVDARVATLHAIEGWSQLYGEPSTVTRMAAAFEDLLQRYGGADAYFGRLFLPQEPLHHDSQVSRGWNWYARDKCYDKHTAPNDLECDKQTSEDDEKLSKKAQAGAAAQMVAKQALTASLDTLTRLGVLTRETGPQFNKNWNYVYIFGKWPPGAFDCVPVLGLMDLVIPGYTINKQKLDMFAARNGAVTGKVEFDVVRLDLCGAVYGGVLENRSAGGGGSLAAQIGHPHAYEFKIGRLWWGKEIKIRVESWVGIVVTVDLSARVSSGSLVLTLEAYLDFVAHGSIGWKSGAFAKRLWGPFHRSWTFGENGQANAASSSSLGPVTPTLPGAVEGSERAILLALAEGHLAGLSRDPDKRAALEGRLGRSLEEVPAGTVLDLSDPTFHALFVGDGEPLHTALRLPGGYVLGSGVQPRVGGLQARELASCAPLLTVAVAAACDGQAKATSQSAPTCASWQGSRACAETGGKPGASLETREPAGEAFARAHDTKRTVDDQFHARWNQTCKDASRLAPGGAGNDTLAFACEKGHPAYDETDADPGHVCQFANGTSTPWIGPTGTMAFGCYHYRLATAGGFLAPDHAGRFHVATTVLSVDANKDAWSVAVELCPPGGIPLACDAGAGGAVNISDPRTYDTVTWIDRQLTQWYESFDGVGGLFCGFHQWSWAMLGGANPNCPV
ncbi:MAG TPA: hypothetical protein VM681_11100 [Candidatus Thermoplasmatota archaeon]|nr:hypothetical protein [Candidatus Thermoplasmatota archaeon]